YCAARNSHSQPAMIRISNQQEFASIALGSDAKLWIEQSSSAAPNGEMRIRFRAFRPAPLDVLPTYAAADGVASTAWPPVPVAATLYLSPNHEDVEEARCKRILVTRRSGNGESCKDLLGFVPGRDSDTDDLVLVQLEQIEERAQATDVPVGVELLVSSHTSSSVTGLVN
ncbi:hypothetical protein BOX15_Mlig016787g1, partial [Macrostomum lignano]